MDDQDLTNALLSVSLPTLGHYLDEGFLAESFLLASTTKHMVGKARTLYMREHDAGVVNRAILETQPGEVLVIDTGNDVTHACIGAVTITALAQRGAAGVLLNGAVTDIDVLETQTIPVFARGLSACTTKLKGTETLQVGVPLTFCGVTIHQGDWIIGDRNGVLVADSATLSGVMPDALAAEAMEPLILKRIRDGEELADILWCGK